MGKTTTANASEWKLDEKSSELIIISAINGFLLYSFEFGIQ